MKRVNLLAALAAACFLAHVPAHATTTSSASLSDLTVTLYDTNPLDGVTPWISFAGSSYSSTWAHDTNPYDYQSHSASGTGAFEATSSSSATAHAIANASTTGNTPNTLSNGSTVVGSLTASGSATGTSGTPGSDYSAYAASAYWNSGGTSFTVSANTLVVFTANASTALSMPAYDGISPYNWEYAYAGANLSISGPGPSGGGSQSSSDQLSLSSYSASNYDPINNVYLPVSLNSTGALGASFFNNTGTDMNGSFSAQVDVYGTSYVAAVPEPATHAMLLAGLALVGGITRLRGRRS